MLYFKTSYHKTGFFSVLKYKVYIIILESDNTIILTVLQYR